MRPRLLALLVGLAGLAVAPFPAGTASASCAGPQINVQRVDVVRGHPVLTRGSEVTVRGTYFIDGCDDTGGSSTTLGCTTEDQHEVETPMHDTELRLGDELMGTEDADEEGRIAWTFTVPDDLRPGLTTLYVAGYRHGWVRIR